MSYRVEKKLSKILHLHLKMVAMVVEHQICVARVAFPWRFLICELPLENQVVVLAAECLQE